MDKNVKTLNQNFLKFYQGDLVQTHLLCLLENENKR